MGVQSIGKNNGLREPLRALPVKLLSLKRLEEFSSHRLYTVIIACLAGLDAFVFIVPNEALLIVAVLARPKRWIWTALWVSLGSSVGSVPVLSAGINFVELTSSVVPVAGVGIVANRWYHAVVVLNEMRPAILFIYREVKAAFFDLAPIRAELKNPLFPKPTDILIRIDL